MLGILAKNVRSRETRKNQGNLEAAVKGNSHGGLAGMQMLKPLYACAVAESILTRPRTKKAWSPKIGGNDLELARWLSHQPVRNGTRAVCVLEPRPQCGVAPGGDWFGAEFGVEKLLPARGMAQILEWRFLEPKKSLQ